MWRFKRAGVLLLALTSFTAAMASTYYSTRPRQIGLVPDRDIMQVGKLRQGGKIRHTFELINHGPGTATILGVRPQCDCTGVEVGKPLLKAGEKTTVAATWNVGNERGNAESAIMVIVDDDLGKSRRFDLTMSGVVSPDIGYEPQTLRFTENEPQEVQLRFFAGELRQVKIGGAYCTHRAFTVEVLPVSSTEETLVRIAFDPELWSTGGQAQFIAETNSSHERLCVIRVAVLQANSQL